MDNNQKYHHWRVEQDKDQIFWAYFDKKDASVNTIDPNVMEEFTHILDEVQQSKIGKGLIIASAKKNGFIAGADISLFNQFHDIQHAIHILDEGQAILNKLEKLTVPTLALIDGYCLGGGLELALACTYRIAEEGDKTRLGLPEVKLGIHPGWGGTIRLPRLIGPIQGLNMILSGHTINSKVAAKLGLVDLAVPKRQLYRAARHYILNQPSKKHPKFWHRLLENRFMRQVLAYFMRKKLAAKIDQAHYPAPFQALDNWENYGVYSKDSYAKEAKTCGRLFFSETCQNLVRVFFLQEQLKALAKPNHNEFKHVHVIGAGTMGGDIAAWCAYHGCKVTLQDVKPDYIAKAFKRAYKLYQTKLKQPHLIQQALDRLIPDLAGNGLSQADIIIEAVVENLEIKQTLFKEIERKAKPEAILATNTSSIPLDEINQVLNQAERLVGIHFFNPVAKMMLVEVVKGHQTSPHIFEGAKRFVRQIDRLPLPVKSSPGFLINRILMPYLLESVKLMEEGIPIQAIDQMMENFGMPMGPITLADTVGLDVCLSVAKYLSQYFNTPIPNILIEKVNQGHLGKKTQQGFYHYDKQGRKIEKQGTHSVKPHMEITNRLVLTMLNEAFACLREGVIEQADWLDAGMVFGTGFAPFRGGPIQYAKSQGIQNLFQQFLKQHVHHDDNIPAWEELV